MGILQIIKIYCNIYFRFWYYNIFLSFAKFTVNYKAELKGNIILENDKWFASSKTCPNCGNIKKDLTLRDRVYIASINLHNKLPRVHREVTPVESETSQLVLNAQGNWRTALNLSDALIDLTSIVEAGIKHHL